MNNLFEDFEVVAWLLSSQASGLLDTMWLEDHAISFLETFCSRSTGQVIVKPIAEHSA